MKSLFYAVLLFAMIHPFSMGQNSEPVTASYEGHIFKPRKVDATPDRIKSLTVPAGFKVNVFARDLGKIRIMAMNKQGKIYVSNPDKGVITMLSDDNNDGIADTKKVVQEKDKVHGLTVHDNYLYFTTVKEVYRSTLNDDGTLKEPEQLIRDLPDGGQHDNRTIYFGPDNKLYITVGSTCNACDEPNDENATVLVADELGKNREIFAKGLRNTIGIDWHPVTRELFGMDHGIDWLGDDEQKEELNKLIKGKNYGWPYIFADGKENPADDPKEGSPKMSYSDYKKQTTSPVFMLTAHSAPMNFIFYTGTQFPPEYRNDAFVTLHGSWNRETPSGYKVVRIKFKNNTPVEAQDFLTGFLVNNNKAQFGRVVGLLQLPDGSLLVSEDANGVIYRISYNQ